MKRKECILVPIEEFYELKAMVKEIASDMRIIAADKSKETLTPKEVCAALKIGRSTYQRLVDKKVITERQPGGPNTKVFVYREDLEEAMREGKL